MARQTAIFFQKGLEGATNSLIAYDSDVGHVTDWLVSNELASLPMSSATLATYLSDLATEHKWATVSRRLASIRKWHRLHQQPDPSIDEGVKIVLKGIKRTIGTEPLLIGHCAIDQLICERRVQGYVGKLNGFR